MGPSAKILSLVTTAIKNLQEMKGSTSKEILNYITHLTNLSSDMARRQMKTALKRGVAYGIIKKKGCYYTLPTDAECECQEIAAQELGLLDLRCRRKRKEKRDRKCKEKKEKRKKGCKKHRKHKMKACTCKKKKKKKACKTRRKSRCKKAKRKKKITKCCCPPPRRAACIDEKSSKPSKINVNSNENDTRIDSNPLMSRGRTAERNARLSCERNAREENSIERNSRERSSSSSKESDNPMLN